MTDELTPEQEAEISRLLAEARHDGPIPADVAARLDAVLGDLSADDLESLETGGTETSAKTSGTVVELDGVRRRRRNAGRLLLAAAAVVVGGIAVGQNLDTMGSDQDAQTADSAGGSQDQPRAEAEEGAGDDLGSTAAEPETPPAETTAGTADEQRLFDELNAPLRFTSGNFEAEAVRDLGEAGKVRRDAANFNLSTLEEYAAVALWTCPDADYGEGAKLPAYLDEQEAVLVLRRPQAGIQRVVLLECGTATELAAVDLPAR